MSIIKKLGLLSVVVFLGSFYAPINAMQETKEIKEKKAEIVRLKKEIEKIERVMGRLKGEVKKWEEDQVAAWEKKVPPFAKRTGQKTLVEEAEQLDREFNYSKLGAEAKIRYLKSKSIPEDQRSSRDKQIISYVETGQNFPE